MPALRKPSISSMIAAIQINQMSLRIWRLNRRGLLIQLAGSL